VLLRKALNEVNYVRNMIFGTNVHRLPNRMNYDNLEVTVKGLCYLATRIGTERDLDRESFLVFGENGWMPFSVFMCSIYHRYAFTLLVRKAMDITGRNNHEVITMWLRENKYWDVDYNEKLGPLRAKPIYKHDKGVEHYLRLSHQEAGAKHLRVLASTMEQAMHYVLFGIVNDGKKEAVHHRWDDECKNIIMWLEHRGFVVDKENQLVKIDSYGPLYLEV